MIDKLENGAGYTLYHSIGVYPGKAAEVRDELGKFADAWCATDSGQWDYALTMRQEFIDRWCRLINAPEGSLTTTENVTASLYSLIGAIPDERLRGRRVLAAADCFPSMHFLLARMAESRGFELETVPLRQGQALVHDEDMIERWSDDVALALLTWVSSTTSNRVDLKRLAEHGRARGSLIGVDITQGVGVLPYDVMDPEVDFVISSSLKWLCGGPGGGILYVRPDFIGECRPEFCGWFSQPSAFNWDLDKFAYAGDIRRFDHGTPAIVPCAASLPGLRWHEKTGIEAIRAHNLALTSRLIGAATEQGWDLLTPVEPERRGGSVMIRLPGEIEPADLLAAMARRGIMADNRGQIVRFSPGAVTSEAAMDGILEALAEYLI